ncbi:hypothetical protein KKE60_08135, partial [Patescibacteria group bacterium]|nr:hypothetical protein [Patescibacteria group bacterium]
MAQQGIISEVMPAAILSIEGQIWDKLSTGQSFWYINDEWIPFAGVKPLEYFSNRRVIYILNGVDITDYIEKGSFEISESYDSGEYNTATLIINNYDRSLTITPGQEIIVYRKETLESDPVKMFSGRLVETPQSHLGFSDSDGLE